jgi:hypothetical protein
VNIFRTFAAALVSGLLLAGCNSEGTSSSATSVAAPKVSTAHASSDPDFRVVIGAASSPDGTVSLPSPSQDWLIQFQFSVPPLPDTSSWDYLRQVFYIWGDIDFDMYGSTGKYMLSDYLYNQIVPQLMTGWALAGNNSDYKPTWEKLQNWVIQSCYFWQTEAGDVYAQTGEVVDVKPGDAIVEHIQYHANSGSIDASISAPEGTSAISIPRPFPNENVPLFSSWTSFFEQAIAKSGVLYGRPMANVETHYVDQSTICSTLPWSVEDIEIPGISSAANQYSVTQTGTYTCASKLANLRF